MKSVLVLATCVLIAICGYSYGHADINDDGSVDLQDFSSLQTEFAGPQTRVLAHAYVDATHPAIVPGTTRFVVRTIAFAGGNQLRQNGAPVFAGLSSNGFSPLAGLQGFYVFPADGSLVLDSGAQLTVPTGSEGQLSLTGYVE